jgi:RNA polymerase sigma-70 factor (ECF subfamily)
MASLTVGKSAEEDALRAGARDGAIAAVGELYRRHADAVYAVALRITGSTDDAQDVLQDVFVGLPRALRSYRETGRFESWLKRVTVRTALARMRTTRRKRELPLTDAALAVSVPRSHPVERIALERAIARLPETLRVVFVLKEVEGYAHGEIASLLGITAASSMTRLSRAWAALRQEIDR